jgi:hypothetical protein
MSDQSQYNDTKRLRHSAYEAKYPFNRVIVEESGHEIHYDNTPGKERVRHAHKSGTYSETRWDGEQQKYVENNYQKYVKGGYTKTLDSNYDSKMEGSKRQNVGGGDHKETQGTTSSARNHHNKSLNGKDKAEVTRGDDCKACTGNRIRKYGGSGEYKFDGTPNNGGGGQGTAVGAASTSKKKENSLHVISDKKTKIESGDKLTISSEKEIELKVGQSIIRIKSGSINIKSSKIHEVGACHHGVDSEDETAKNKDEVYRDQQAKQVFVKIGMLLIGFVVMSLLSLPLPRL